MTFLEKLMKDNPSLPKGEVESMAIYHRCPFQYGYENKKRCDGNKTWDECRDCWNREMPNTESMEEKLFNNFEYDKGLKDGVDLIFRVEKLDYNVRNGLFGTNKYNNSALHIIKLFEPQEVLAKLKVYEESKKIKVGDVLVFEGKGGLVIREKNDDRCEVEVVGADGIHRIWEKYKCKKTEKHIDIQQILDQIGE